MPPLIIGTRGSVLATTQSGHVAEQCTANGYPSELKIITTVGDVNMAPVERIGVGVFTQALREALAAGECDIAVHSFKDLPTAPDDRFDLVVPARADARDCLIARDGLTLEELPANAVVGTGAPRRIAQITALRPDITTRPLRGNIDTRMAKVTTGELDAVVLAYAGLSRVGRAEDATEVFDPHRFVPAPAQGALAVECRRDDDYARAALATIVDAPATVCATAERAVLRRLEAGCTAPVAALATIADGTLELLAAVTAVDGATSISATVTIPMTIPTTATPVTAAMTDDAVRAGYDLADELISQGAATIVNS